MNTQIQIGDDLEKQIREFRRGAVPLHGIGLTNGDRYGMLCTLGLDIHHRPDIRRLWRVNDGHLTTQWATFAIPGTPFGWARLDVEVTYPICKFRVVIDLARDSQYLDVAARTPYLALTLKPEAKMSGKGDFFIITHDPNALAEQLRIAAPEDMESMAKRSGPLNP